ncbi:MAG: glycosyltransferase family 8 protein [Acutalibacteraceae bacterium]|nr:glycosyltransferase family 8 protein [Acutalibacteraceae bacterium]
MNIFVALDSNYIHPLCVMFNSLAKTNAKNSFDIYVAYSSLTEEDFDNMAKALGSLDARIHRVLVDENIFSGAPVLDRLSKATYYRLLIGDILPADVDRLLYLDPDIVINGDLTEMYNTDLKGCVLAGGTHLYGFNEWVNFYRLRVKRKRRNHYINAGVLLIDLDMWRKTVTLEEILDFIQKKIRYLLLADQDVINVLFADKLVKIDERKYNLDEKTFSYFRKKKDASQKIDLDWVRKNSVIIHYNGKHKPWNELDYKGELGEFYERYRNF